MQYYKLKDIQLSVSRYCSVSHSGLILSTMCANWFACHFDSPCGSDQ